MKFGLFQNPRSLVRHNFYPGDGPPELPDGVFGSGAGGNVTINNDTELTNDIECTNLTFTGTNQHVMVGMHPTENRPIRIKVSDTLTIASNTSFVLSNSGYNYVAPRLMGGTLEESNRLPRPGGAGGTHGGEGAPVGTEDLVGTPGEDQLLPSIGSRGGRGIGPLYSTDKDGALGGECNVVTLTTLDQLITGMYGGQQIGGGSGGGSGLNWAALHSGGAGGGGGGLIHILAKNIVVSNGAASRIEAIGGQPGFSSYAGNGVQVGGGGGNGGIIIVTENFDPRIALNTYLSAGVNSMDRASAGHIYLASKHTDGAYIYDTTGWYHPVTLV